MQSITSQPSPSLVQCLMEVQTTERKQGQWWEGDNVAKRHCRLIKPADLNHVTCNDDSTTPWEDAWVGKPGGSTNKAVGRGQYSEIKELLDPIPSLISSQISSTTSLRSSIASTNGENTCNPSIPCLPQPSLSLFSVVEYDIKVQTHKFKVTNILSQAQKLAIRSTSFDQMIKCGFPSSSFSSSITTGLQYDKVHTITVSLTPDLVK